MFERLKKYFISNQGFLRYNFLLALIILFCLFVPDIIINCFAGTHILFEPLYALEFFGVLLLLCFCRRGMIISITLLFALIELICLCFWAYFGQPVTASELNNQKY